MRRSISALVTLAVLVGPSGTATATPTRFTIGFTAQSLASQWFADATAAGGRLILLSADWRTISPRRPASDPTDPANPAYDWGSLDQYVRAASAHGLTVAITVGGGGAPSWADGPHKPRNVLVGTWRPNAAAFAAFGAAIARRYSGRFNPGRGVLPHVRYFEVWSEENLSDRLTPQWIRVHGVWIAEGAIVYRGLLNAFYAAVKSVDRSDKVIVGGLAPFGDTPGSLRVPPATFARTLLCIGGSNFRLTLARCPDPAHFDIFAIHPYAIGGPFTPALNPGDISVPDMWKITRPLSVAERTGRALPRGRKPLWVTEFSWDSDPPDPRAVPIATWRRWVEESFYEYWKQGVSVITWFSLFDQPCSPSCAVTYQSGAYYDNGKRKPGFEAFRFPFVVEPAGRGRSVVWGIAPDSGTVLVQELRLGRWTTVAKFLRSAHGLFTRTIALSGHPPMRARVGAETSLIF